MVDIQIVPTPSSRPDAVAGAAPAAPAGDSGFALLAGLAWPGTSWPAAVMSPAASPATPSTGAAPAMTDPLAAWMEEQQGFSGQFAPASEDPLAGLPEPEPDAMIQAVLPAAEEPAPLPPALTAAARADETIPESVPNVDTVIPDDLPIAKPDTVSVAAAPTTAGMSTAPTPPAMTIPFPGPVMEVQLRDRRMPFAPSDAPPPVSAGPATAPTPATMPLMAAQRDMQLAPPPAPDSAAPGPTATAPSAPPQASADRAAPVRDVLPLQRPDPAPATGLAAGLADIVLDPTLNAEPLTPRSTATGATVATGPAWQAATQDPRPVLNQIAEAVVTTRGDRTEIALSPEELGRIRLIMSGPDRAHVVIWAERPETLDLVRRNADLLTQQLAEAGVNPGTMEFRRDDRPDWQGATPGTTERDEEATLPAVAAIRLSQAPLSDRRVDIRL